MHVWVDAQLPPRLAQWLAARFSVTASHVSDLGLLTATDDEIFERARAADVVVLTKDLDFVQLLERRGPPPRVVWLTVGNLTNEDLLRILEYRWPRAMDLLAAQEPLVEITRY